MVLRLEFVSKGRILNLAAVRTDSHERPWLWDNAETITVTRTQEALRPEEQGETGPSSIKSPAQQLSSCRSQSLAALC